MGCRGVYLPGHKSASVLHGAAQRRLLVGGLGERGADRHQEHGAAVDDAVAGGGVEVLPVL